MEVAEEEAGAAATAARAVVVAAPAVEQAVRASFTPRPAPNAASPPKFPSSPPRADRSIAATASKDVADSPTDQ